MFTTFVLCATVGGTVLVISFLFTLFGFGHDGEVGHDASHGVADHGVTDGDVHAGEAWLVGMFSLRALVGAVTFFGLGGLASQSAGFDPLPTLIIALACGFAAMYIVAVMMTWLRGLAADRTVRIGRAVGAVGTVYLPIPRERTGQGKVHLALQGATSEYLAVTPHTDSLPTGSRVVVTAVISADTVEVMPEEAPVEMTSDA